MLKNTTQETGDEVVWTEKKRMPAFAFKRGEHGIEIKIIGCLDLKPVPSQPFYSKGTILLNDKVFSVFDLQALAGLGAKTITDDSCIVLLDPDESFQSFSRAIVVDNVTEMIKIAERNLEGLPVDALYGRSRSKKDKKETSESSNKKRNPEQEEGAALDNKSSNEKREKHRV